MSNAFVERLLELAHVPEARLAEARWRLSMVLEAAAPSPPNPKRDLSPADWNPPLESVLDHAEKLLDSLKKLRARPYQHLSLWQNEIFGEVEGAGSIDRDIAISVETGHERSGAIRAVLSIREAAKAALCHHNGHPASAWDKRRAIDRAAEFWARYSSKPISGSQTGAFHKFAEELYAHVSGHQPTDIGRGVLAQVRDAAKRVKQNPPQHS